MKKQALPSTRAATPTSISLLSEGYSCLLYRANESASERLLYAFPLITGEPTTSASPMLFRLDHALRILTRLPGRPT